MARPPEFVPIGGSADARLGRVETHLVKSGAFIAGAWESAEGVHEEQGRRLRSLEETRTEHGTRLTRVEVRLTLYAAAAAFGGSIIGGVILIVIQNALAPK